MKDASYTSTATVSLFIKPYLSHPFITTDTWVEEHGVQNPALFDCFPRFLQDSLKGLGDTMPKTINRMTGASADRFGIKGRGYLKDGYFADLTVFDENELQNTVPDKKSAFGIRKVMINGKIVCENGALDTEALKTSGKAIRG